MSGKDLTPRATRTQTRRHRARWTSGSERAGLAPCHRVSPRARRAGGLLRLRRHPPQGPPVPRPRQGATQTAIRAGYSRRRGAFLVRAAAAPVVNAKATAMTIPARGFQWSSRTGEGIEGIERRRRKVPSCSSVKPRRPAVLARVCCFGVPCAPIRAWPLEARTSRNVLTEAREVAATVVVAAALATAAEVVLRARVAELTRTRKVPE